MEVGRVLNEFDECGCSFLDNVAVLGEDKTPFEIEEKQVRKRCGPLKQKEVAKLQVYVVPRLPETGLEPALPLQEPGPQPGLCAKSWQCHGVGVMLQVLKDHWLTPCKRFVHIVLTQWSNCQCLYQIFTKRTLAEEAWPMAIRRVVWPGSLLSTRSTPRATTLLVLDATPTGTWRIPDTGS
jgi:hypothetical protein